MIIQTYLVLFGDDMTEIWNNLQRPLSKRKCYKLSFPRHNRMAQIGFE